MSEEQPTKEKASRKKAVSNPEEEKNNCTGEVTAIDIKQLRLFLRRQKILELYKAANELK